MKVPVKGLLGKILPLSLTSAAPPIFSGCTIGPTLSSTYFCVGGALVRFDKVGGARVGYLRGVALAEVLAAEAAVLEGPAPIVIVDRAFAVQWVWVKVVLCLL